MAYRTLDDLDVKGKRVLVRADLNVPMKDGRVTDATRIERQAPTIRELSKKDARVIVLSHFDRPKGKVVPSMSLKPIAEPLAKAIGRPVAFAEDCVGEKAEAAVAKLTDGDVVLLENTRFHAGEEKNDADFAKQIAKLGDIFVNDAFSAAHRAHASTVGIANLLPNAAGRSMQKELVELKRVLGDQHGHKMAVIGGAKISTKIEILENLVKKVDVLVIGGAMANTFFAAAGLNVGKSLYEASEIETANRILDIAKEEQTEIVLPTDVVVAKDLSANTAIRTISVAANDVGPEERILDVGPASIEDFRCRIRYVDTLVWNGPMGAFEVKPFDQGTTKDAQAVAKRTQEQALISVAGGGDTAAALSNANVEEMFTYVSTAGGAFLEWLEGKTLPGVAALEAKR